MGRTLLSKNKLFIKVLVLVLVLLSQGAFAYGESLEAEGEKDLEPGAVLEMKTEEFEKGKEIKFDIKNVGETELTFARMFEVEYYNEESENWETIELDIVWPQDMIMLLPGESHTQTLNQDNFAQEAKKGLYRINKDIQCFDTGKEFELQEEFEIIPKTSKEETIEGIQDDITYIYKNGELKLDWGQKNTGGYEISIEEFSIDDNKLIVDYALTSPGDAPVIQVITHPTDTKTIPSEMREFDEIELNLLEHNILEEEKLDEEDDEEEKEEKDKLFSLILRLFRLLPFNLK